jgi:hypothetical protein
MSVPNFKLLRGKDYDEIDLNLNTVEVNAATRRVRVRWTPELAQDLRAFHNLSAEEELTRLLSEQISREIDQEILNNIFPAVNRTVARTIAQDLVSVQPMGGPVGNLHYLDYVYDNYNFKNFKLLKG